MPPGQRLFESILVFENYPVEEPVWEQISGLEVQQVHNFEHTDYPLTLSVISGQHLQLRLSYACGRFDKEILYRVDVLAVGFVESGVYAEDLLILEDLAHLFAALWGRV